jgi:hypothetical protein
MPRGTTLRNFRAEDALWRRAQDVAAKRDESLSDVLRAALVNYIAQHESAGSEEHAARVSKHRVGTDAIDVSR